MHNDGIPGKMLFNLLQLKRGLLKEKVAENI